MSAAEKQAMKSSSSVADSDEKAGSVRVERVLGDADVEKVRPRVYNEGVDVSGVDERKLLRKLDLWLVPWLSFLYLLSFLDRTSIGNAKVSLIRMAVHALGLTVHSVRHSCMALKSPCTSMTRNITLL